MMRNTSSSLVGFIGGLIGLGIGLAPLHAYAAPVRIIPKTVRASGVYADRIPQHTYDGDPNTPWNSGSYAPQWIEFDLGLLYDITQVRLLTAQAPAGPTDHVILVGSAPNPTTVYATLQGQTDGGMWLESKKPASWVRYVRVLTRSSPSWISWKEIEIWGQAADGPRAANLYSGSKISQQESWQSMMESLATSDPATYSLFKKYGSKLDAAISAGNLSALSYRQQVLDEHLLNRLGYGPNPLGLFHDARPVSPPGVPPSLANLRWIEPILKSMYQGKQTLTLGTTIDRDFIARHPYAAESYLGITKELIDLTNQRTQAVQEGRIDDATAIAVQLNLLRNDLVATAQEWLVTRATLNEYAFGEVINEFWLNHFNVDGRKVAYDLLDYTNRAIRPRIFGKFEDLLLAVARHPAMLTYLDNYVSVDPDAKLGSRGLNENYGREIMELHTLGVGPTEGVYDQDDVYQSALILTGWGIQQTPERGREFFFNQALHNKRAKTVMGVNFTSTNGYDEGVKFIRFLANHPQTRKNICKKLAIRLLGENGQALAAPVNDCVQVWGDTGGNLSAIYLELLSHSEFWSNLSFRNKVKRPLEFVVSARRAFGVNSTTFFTRELAAGLVKRSAALGQDLLRFGPPTGYSEYNAEWRNPGYLAGAVAAVNTDYVNDLPFIACAPGAPSPARTYGEAAERSLSQALLTGDLNVALSQVHCSVTNDVSLGTAPGASNSFQSMPYRRRLTFGADGVAGLVQGLRKPDRQPTSAATTEAFPMTTILRLIVGSPQFLLR
jgi:uncharacterized protein (DUF1800 family)